MCLSHRISCYFRLFSRIRTPWTAVESIIVYSQGTLIGSKSQFIHNALLCSAEGRVSVNTDFDLFNIAATLILVAAEIAFPFGKELGN